MEITRRILNSSLALAVLCAAGSPIAGQAFGEAKAFQAADNSAQNKGQTTTADKQSNATEDRHTAAQVRKAIVADKDLSTYGHNVKVIVANGTVTLKGPVKSDDEKQKVAADAASIVSADKVANQLTVKQ